MTPDPTPPPATEVDKTTQGASDNQTHDKAEADGKIDWGHELRSAFWLVLAVLLFHSFVAKPFYIPSDSMMPVLLKGDRLIVTKYPYGWSYASPIFHPLPFIHGRLWGAMPERGDIVIIYSPEWKEDYIKRVIGLPGDVIEMRSGQVFLNNEPLPQEPIAPLALPVDANIPCPPDQFPGSLITDRSGKSVCELPVKRETLPSGRHYLVLDTGASEQDWFGPMRVPDGHVFLLGDNRDDSADSRVSIDQKGLGGPVPIENIGGRAEFITFSFDGMAGWNPISWFTSLRSGRAGNSLHPSTDSAVAGSAVDR